MIVVHGGAGRGPRGGAAAEPPYRAALEAAATRAHGALVEGLAALDAAQAAVEVLEDSPLFNAGRGSVRNARGEVEMDAGIVSGDGVRAGAVAGVRGVRHPIALARAVLERTPHVLLAGPGADRLAEEWGLELVSQEWLLSREDAASSPGGTVGAVVLDAQGGLAAATSTGGMRDQLPGRIGDSPLVGAGTYADAACAVSATGDGEALIRAVAAHEVSALARHGGLSLADACDTVLHERLVDLGARAGLIAVDAHGDFAMPFTTDAMYRAWKVGDEPPRSAIGRAEA